TAYLAPIVSVAGDLIERQEAEIDEQREHMLRLAQKLEKLATGMEMQPGNVVAAANIRELLDETEKLANETGTRTRSLRDKLEQDVQRLSREAVDSLETHQFLIEELSGSVSLHIFPDIDQLPNEGVVSTLAGASQLAIPMDELV